jgi:hypothetical protein
LTAKTPPLRVSGQTEEPITSASPPTILRVSIVAAFLLWGAVSPPPYAHAQLANPAEAKAATNCEKNVSSAGRTFINSGFKSLKKCVDSVFA